MSQEGADGYQVVGYEWELPWLPEVFGSRSTILTRFCVECNTVLFDGPGRPLIWREVDAECEWRWSALGLEAETDYLANCQRCGKHLLYDEPVASPLLDGHQTDAAIVGRHVAEASTAEALPAALGRYSRQHGWDEESETAKAFEALVMAAYHRRWKELHPEEAR